MEKSRYVKTKFWSDNYIVELDPIEKFLFLYFITNTHTNICGIYEIPLRIVAFDTGIDKDMLLKILTRFEKDKKIYYIDGWIVVTNFIKNQVLTNERNNVYKGILREFGLVPKNIWLRIDEKPNLLAGLISPLKGLEGAYKNLQLLIPIPIPNLDLSVAGAGSPASTIHASRKTPSSKDGIAPLPEEPPATEIFSLPAYLEGMEKNKDRRIKIIRLFWIEKKATWDNLLQVRAEVARNLNAAKSLLGYTDEQIISTMKFCSSRFTDGEFRWTLETVGKYIGEQKNASEGKGKITYR